jgi:hypothetical protein
MPSITLHTYAFVSLDLAKSFLKIPDAVTADDDLIKLWINTATDDLERECDRQLSSRAVTGELHHGRGQNALLLRQWPITAISELRIDAKSEFTDASTLIPTTDYQVGDDGNSIIYKNAVFPRGYNNLRVTYTAGFTTVPSDLVMAALWIVSWMHSIRNAADIGRASKNKEGETVSYLQTSPQYVKDAVARYKRTEFPSIESPVHNV